MTVRELAGQLGLEPVCEAEPDREVTGGYVGDLLSWVMGRAQAGDAWITIMSNNNVIAVATLTDAALVILAENVSPDPGVATAMTLLLDMMVIQASPAWARPMTQESRSPT